MFFGKASTVPKLLWVGICLAFTTAGCHLTSNEQQSRQLVSQSDIHTTEAYIRYARFRLVALDSTSYLLHIPVGEADTLRYLLATTARPAPTGYQYVKIPVQHMAVLSTTHIGFLQALNAAHPSHLAAVPDTIYIYNDSLHAHVRHRRIAILAGEPPTEQLAQCCQVVCTSSPAKAEWHEKLKRVGVVEIPVLEWLEEHPLAKAEWIKLFGILVGKAQQAFQYFQSTERAYQQLCQYLQAQRPAKQPLVIVGLPFQGQWHVAGGNSFIARFIEDAGGRYYWKHLPQSGSIPVSFEQVYQAGLQADIWLHPGAGRSLKDILSTDPRLADFKALQQARVYNRTRRLSPKGANDYWESGTVNPHLILADLMAIFHPEYFPQHTFVYYEQLNGTE